jgi:3',5'-cyclic AMP phosphodiesterase CpdA
LFALSRAGYLRSMPGLHYQPIRRREFLKVSVVTGAAVVVQGCRAMPGAQFRNENEEIHLALLSDTHIGTGESAKDPRGFDPSEQLRRVLPHIISGAPRGVILNGDAASREGLPTDYRELKSLLEPLSRVAPIYIGLGNHDHRANFKEVFATSAGLKADVLNHHVLIIEESFCRFIILDSLLYTKTAAGLLGEHQRAWLADYLKSHSDKPIILFVHHTLGDSDGDLLDANRLFEIIRPSTSSGRGPHRQVKAIFYGHSHSWEIGEKQGVKLINLPSLGYNFWEGQPVGWVDARFRRDGVALTLHAIAGNRADDGKTSQIRWS